MLKTIRFIITVNMDYAKCIDFFARSKKKRRKKKMTTMMTKN